MKIAIFCSANDNIDKAYFEKTEALGRWLAKRGDDVVCGGCNIGLMECVARAAHEAGAQVVGVVPRMVEREGRSSEYLDVEILCDNLSDRKDLMLAKSDASIALPGGIGTLDEIFSMAASATIGYHRKPVILYNMAAFWSPLVTFLDYLETQHMIRGDYRRLIQVANTLEELDSCLSRIGR